jgi:nucleotide-binding universal stress UspA family protein
MIVVMTTEATKVSDEAQALGEDPVQRRVVVGIDGSPGSKDALRSAAAEATWRQASLDVVSAWVTPTYLWAGAYAEPGFSPEEFEQQAAAVLARTVLEVLGPDPASPVTARVVEGRPAAVLLEAARGAELLVVGSRGRGGFASLTLGSVSQQCAHHASCPLLIVPARRSAAAEL